MKRAIWCGLITTASILALGAAPAQGIRVLLGNIEYCEPRTEQDFEKDKALYAHDNAQLIAVQVDRTLVGELSQKRVVVRVSVDDRSSLGVKWVAGSYGILDPAAWHTGARVVLILDEAHADPKTCSPILAPKNDTRPPAALGVVLGTETGKLGEYAGDPLYCESVRNVLLLRE